MMLQQQPVIPKTRMPTQSAAIPILQTKHALTSCRAASNNFNQACIENGHDELDIDRDEDVLSPLPGDELPSAGSSPGALSRSPIMRPGSMSPRSHRRRAHTMDSVAFARHNSTHLTHVPKDPIQPKQGSIQDIHSVVREENEEDDVFSELPAMRPRSSTCPANMNRARRVKLRSLRRPPTPPPMDLVEPRVRTPVDSSIEEELDGLVDKIEDSSPT